MAHNKHVIDKVNLDLVNHTREDYLEMTKDWVDPYGIPTVVEHDGVKVVRDDMITGSKCRFADLLMANIKEDTVVYVVPRVGLAGISIVDSAKKFNKKVVLFMPASKEISDHQAICIEKGAVAKFRRIAAMPVLNGYAKKWAEENNAFFVPLGLKHPLVTAAIVRVCDNLTKVHGEPGVVFCATSTGVLTRGLQIGWPNADFISVAVARNLKAGELGRAGVISEPLPFKTPEKKENLPPFPCVKTYDSKVWKCIPKNKPEINAWMWNVGQDVFPEDPTIKQRTDSQREWGEFRD